MSSVESNKNLAGIGSLLLLFPVLSIVGVILLYVSIKGLSEYYKDESIIRDAVRGFIFLIIAAIAIAVDFPLFIISGVFSAFVLGPLGIGFGLIALLLSIVLALIFYVLAAMSLRKSFSSLAQKSGEHMFETAGTLLFVGAVLTIVLLGFFLIFIAWIMTTIAFFSIKVPQQSYNYSPQPTTAPTIQATRFCPNCGAPVDKYATFCPHCGKQLPPF
jgi:uncharacterized membrane protein